MQVRLVRKTNRRLHPDWSTVCCDCLLVFFEGIYFCFLLLSFIPTGQLFTLTVLCFSLFTRVVCSDACAVRGWGLGIRLSFYAGKILILVVRTTQYAHYVQSTLYHYHYTTYTSLLHTSIQLHFTIYTLDYKKYSFGYFFLWRSKGPITMLTQASFVAQLNAISSRLSCIKPGDKISLKSQVCGAILKLWLGWERHKKFDRVARQKLPM